MKQVLAAVGYAHSKGVVHRDLKPANILVTASGDVKVTDFGIAKVIGDSKLTRTGTSMGSPDYMSPEQVLGKKDIDSRSDIYSLGATVFEMLTGRPPFVISDGGVSDSDYLIKTAHVQQKPPAVQELVPGVPVPVAEAVMKALMKNPEKRHATCAEFLEHLALCSANAPSRANGIAPRRKILFAGVGYSALAIVLSIAVYAKTKDLAETTRRAAELEAKKKSEEVEAKQKADEAEAKRKAEEAEAKRKAEEAEAKRRTEEAEAKRKAGEAEAKRKADGDIERRKKSVADRINADAFNAYELWEGNAKTPVTQYPEGYDRKDDVMTPDGVFSVRETEFRYSRIFFGIPTLDAKVDGALLIYPVKNGRQLKIKFSDLSKNEMKHDSAVQYCKDQGLRLPTIRELFDFCAAGTEENSQGTFENHRCGNNETWSASLYSDHVRYGHWQFYRGVVGINEHDHGGVRCVGGE